jgi:uncharacterized protein
MSIGHTVIVKLAERCNLACPYCYMYNGEDQSWRERPKRLSMELASRLTERAAELLSDYPDIHLTLEFHGGEPLLFGRERFASLMAMLRKALPEDRVTYCMQTNGVLLDERWCDLLAQNRVHWSISIDGPKQVHDRFRYRVSGGGSHAAVEAAITRTLSRPEWKRLFGGVLAVVDPDADGGEIVRYFHGLGVNHVDFLMPDATHAALPAHLPGFSQEKLRRFMTGAFDAWTAIDDARFQVRSFAHLISGIYGRMPELDAFGAGLGWLLVVETDGSYQNLDVLHICGEEHTLTGGTLLDRSFGEHYALARAAEVPLCATCQACPVKDVCGGGYLPHRFDGEGFDNPSVHCETLYGLIGHVHAYLQKHLPADVWKTSEAA